MRSPYRGPLAVCRLGLLTQHSNRSLDDFDSLVVTERRILAKSVDKAFYQ